MAKSVISLEKEWQQLYGLLSQLAQNENPEFRALSYSLLEQLSENIFDDLKKHIGTLVAMFTAGCQDAGSHVQVAAMRAASSFLKAVAELPEVMQLKPVLVPMLNVLAACLARNEEETVTEGLEVIQECCAMEAPLINDHIEVRQ